MSLKKAREGLDVRLMLEEKTSKGGGDLFAG